MSTSTAPAGRATRGFPAPAPDNTAPRDPASANGKESPADQIADARLHGLDRSHGAVRVYRVLDRDAKQRARLAFLAYEDALRRGDVEHAAAARERFLTASKEITRGRVGGGVR